jgi:hypothetical protein
MASKIRFGKLGVALAVALVATAPAGAGRDSLRGASAVGLPSIATASVASPEKAILQDSSLPASMDWLLMLGAFGLLGALTRRATPHPLQDPIYI